MVNANDTVLYYFSSSVETIQNFLITDLVAKDKKASLSVFTRFMQVFLKICRLKRTCVYCEKKEMNVDM